MNRKIPDKILEIVGNQSSYSNNVGMSDSEVLIYPDYVLKIQAESEETKNEKDIVAWLDGQVPVPGIPVYYVEDGTAYTLMTRITGKMLCDEEYLNNPKQLIRCVAEGLRTLWKVDVTKCPFRTSRLEERLKQARWNVENNLVDMENVETETFGEGGFRDPEELICWLEVNRPKEDIVFTHGDFCLPNVFVENNRISGFIDLGKMGPADRWQDIAIALRSLNHNFAGHYNGGKKYFDFTHQMLLEELELDMDYDKFRYYILLDELISNITQIGYGDEFMKITELCIKYALGKIIEEPKLVTGGLMHKMYHVSTDQGEYAIKLLNPDIMKRPEALTNMIHSELVSNALANVIPLIAAKTFQGKNIIEMDGSFFVVFDWLDGKSIFAPDISEYHCEQIGRVLGKIHATQVKIDAMVENRDIREAYDWNLFMEKAKLCNSEALEVLQENIADIMRWDRNVVTGLYEASQNQVISHRDLDPKNVMWKNDAPYIIDWEAAGYVNPFQELIEVLNYWISDETGKYGKAKFDALMQAYTENNNIYNVNWDVILSCSFDGMLGWLEYNLKRALGMEGSGINDQEEGIQQTQGTIYELKKYENQIEQLKVWLDEFVREKYTL